MKYYIIAGEASGDLHGGNLIKGLRAEDPQAQIRVWGGEMMQEAGAELVHHYKEGAVMGVTDVLGKGFKLLKNLSVCKKDISDWCPDVVILIDYPGFNFKIAEYAHKKGFKVFYYIAPKTWASRESRNRKLKKYIDRLFIIFPFEKAYFDKHDIPYVYKGNPLIDAIDRHEYVRPVEGKYIALLAGSRKGEISRMMPVCMQVADRFPGYRFVIAGAPSRTEKDYRKFIGNRDNVELLFSRTYDILKYAEAAVINSGTASLEAALIGTPQVVCWSSSAITIFVAKNILKVMDHIRFISLGNLIMNKFVFQELIQDSFNPDNVTEELRNLLEDSDYRSEMKLDYKQIRNELGGQGASSAVAKAMIEELRK